MTAAAGPAEQTSKACLKVTNWLESRSPWSQTHAWPLTHNRRSEPTKAPENEEWIREGGGSLFMWARATEQRHGSSGGRKEQGLRPSVGRSELGHPERPIQEHEALPFYWEGFTWVPVGVLWAQPSSVGRSSARTHTPTTSVSPSFSLGLGCTGCPNMLEFQINNGKVFSVTMSQLLHGTHLPKKKKKKAIHCLS